MITSVHNGMKALSLIWPCLFKFLYICIRDNEKLMCLSKDWMSRFPYFDQNDVQILHCTLNSNHEVQVKRTQN